MDTPGTVAEQIAALVKSQQALTESVKALTARDIGKEFAYGQSYDANGKRQFSRIISRSVSLPTGTTAQVFQSPIISGEMAINVFLNSSSSPVPMLRVEESDNSNFTDVPPDMTRNVRFFVPTVMTVNAFNVATGVTLLTAAGWNIVTPCTKKFIRIAASNGTLTTLLNWQATAVLNVVFMGI